MFLVPVPPPRPHPCSYLPGCHRGGSGPAVAFLSSVASRGPGARSLVGVRRRNPTVGMNGRAHGSGDPRRAPPFPSTTTATERGVPRHLADFAGTAWRRGWRSGGRFARLVSARALKRDSDSRGVGVGVGRASIHPNKGRQGRQQKAVGTQGNQVRRAHVRVGGMMKARENGAK